VVGDVSVPHVVSGCLLSDAELAQFWQPGLLGPAGAFSMNSPAL
jgi:hypothetical protein